MTRCTCNANQGRGPCSIPEATEPQHYGVGWQQPAPLREFPDLTSRSTLFIAIVIVLVTIAISALLPLGVLS